MQGKYIEIYKEICDYENIIIHRHVRSDYDAIGSQVALYEYIKQNFPQKKVKNATANDYHTFDNLKADVNVLPEDYKDALVIVVDTANYERIDCLQIPKETKLIKIDHHPDETPYGNISLVEANRSSTCEVLFHMFEFLNNTYNLHLNDEIAYALLCGIYADTGGFSFSNTKNETFLTVSKLLEFDINYEELVLKLSSYDEDVMRIVGYAYQNIKINEGVGYLIFDKQFQKEHKVGANKISLVANFLGKFQELKAWVIFNEYESFIRANIRSKGTINISTVAMQFGGGGHKNASGASLYSWDEIEELVTKLKEEVNK